MFTGSTFLTTTEAKYCLSGNFFNGACRTASVSAAGGSSTLHYPYKSTSNCEYSNTSAQTVTSSNFNGYCPIVPGMPEYSAFYSSLSTFYKRGDVQTHSYLTPGNFR